MKKLFIFFLLLFLMPVVAYAKHWEINEFSSDIQLQSDSQLTIRETITASFYGDYQGMYRTIPIRYQSKGGFSFVLRFTLVSVTDANGNPLSHSISASKGYKQIKVWLPAISQNSRQTICITYRLWRAINYFNDHDELYYNVTGDEWPVPIASATAIVSLPQGIDAHTIRTTAYTGAYGSRANNCKIANKDTKIVFTTLGALSYKEGLTIVVGFPKGILLKPGLLSRSAWFLVDNWPFFIPIVSFVLLFFLWYTRGKDPQKKGSIMVQYGPPPGMPPAEVGTLVDETVDLRDISSTVIDLAVRGYLYIKEKETKGLFRKSDYTFTLGKNYKSDRTLCKYEQELLTGIFAAGTTVDLSDLQNKFYKNLPSIKGKIYTRLVENDYFVKRPDKIRGRYTVYGLLCCFCGFAAGVFFQMSSFIIASIITGILFIIFAQIMPKKTSKGVHAVEIIRGFEEYLSRAEKEELKKTSPEAFENFLPYAMALGVAKEWAEKFKDIYSTPPQWYSGPYSTASSLYLVSSLNAMSREMNRTFASSPRSSGASRGSSGFGSGGFSGGGYGGGGGGAF